MARRIAYATVIGVVVVGVVAYFAMDWNQRESSAQIVAATGTLSAAQTFHDFGRVSMRNGKVTQRYRLRNDSDAPALVEQLYTSCMCTETSLLIDNERIGPFGMRGHGYTPRISRVIQPGQDAVVEAVFDPNAHGPAGVGRNDRAVSVLMGGQRVLQLQFTAYVTP
jgi:hypothetical protein